MAKGKENIEPAEMTVDETVEMTENAAVDPHEGKVEVYFPPARSIEEENFVLVIVNGKRYQIQKGERVWVPEEVAEVIRNKEREEKRISERMLARESKM